MLCVKVRVSQDVILCLLAEALLASCGWVSGASKFVHGPGDFFGSSAPGDRDPNFIYRSSSWSLNLDITGNPASR